jgi:hypothetical protein
MKQGAAFVLCSVTKCNCSAHHVLLKRPLCVLFPYSWRSIVISLESKIINGVYCQTVTWLYSDGIVCWFALVFRFLGQKIFVPLL